MLERDGCLTADLADIDAEIHDKWTPILRMYADRKEPDVVPFLQRFGSYVQTHNCQLSPLTVDAIREIAKKKSSQTSCGVDGWRMTRTIFNRSESPWRTTWHVWTRR